MNKIMITCVIISAMIVMIIGRPADYIVDYDGDDQFSAEPQSDEQVEPIQNAVTDSSTYARRHKRQSILNGLLFPDYGTAQQQSQRKRRFNRKNVRDRLSWTPFDISKK